MRKKESSPKSFRLLVIVSILVWVFVIIVALFTLQIRGGLVPYAADDVELKISASGRVVDLNDVGVGNAKLMLVGTGSKKYIYADTKGDFLITDSVPGEYLLNVESVGYKNYESTIELSGGREYNFTLHK